MSFMKDQFGWLCKATFFEEKKKSFLDQKYTVDQFTSQL